MDFVFVYQDVNTTTKRHALVFIFGNRNYGRIYVKGEEVN